MPVVKAARARTLVALFAAGMSCGLPGCAAGAAGADAARPSDAAGLQREPQRYVSSYAYTWFIRAELMRARGDLRGAIRGYRATLADAEADPYVLARFATALDAAGDHAAAEAALHEAFVLDPQSEAAWLARAQIARRRGDDPAAIGAYERAERAAPASGHAPLALAELLRAGGDPERALAVLERYEARTLPGSLGATRARLSLALLRDDAPGTHAAAQALLRASNTAEPLLITATRELLETGRAPLARRIMDALGERADRAPLRFAVLVACGAYAAAETLLAASTPDAFGGLLPLAEAYVAVGRSDEALQLATLARTQSPDDVRAQRLEATLSLELGGLPALAREIRDQ
jgi:hypothetical protein